MLKLRITRHGNQILWRDNYVDAFTVDWSVFFFYAFPPFCLVSRCVHKITQEKASGLLVIPLWPTQPMFSSVLHLLTDVPRVLKANWGNLVHPALVKDPLHNKLSLLLCKVSDSGVPTKVADVVMLSWRPSTHKQYGTWANFCGERKVDPLRPTLMCVLEFLQRLFEQGLSYSALNTARSATSNLDIHSMLTVNGSLVGQHPLVCWFVRGVFNHRKPVPRYTTIWPVEKVLDYLRKLWPLARLVRKELT